MEPKSLKMGLEKRIHLYALVYLILSSSMFDHGRKLFSVASQNNCLATKHLLIATDVFQETIKVLEHFLTKHANFLKEKNIA